MAILGQNKFFYAKTIFRPSSEVVKVEDAFAQLTFTLQCQSALALHRFKPIASLEDHTTVDAVVGRLDKVLRREWFTHLQTLPSHNAHMPTFQDFTSLIQQKLSWHPVQ